VLAAGRAALTPFRCFVLFHLVLLQPLLLLLDILLRSTSSIGTEVSWWTPLAFHVVVMPVVLGTSLAVATWAPTWWICRADRAVAAYSLAVQALTLLHLAATNAAGDQQLHELLLVCALPFVCAIAFHLPWRRSCAVGGVVLGLQLIVTPLLGHDGWDTWLSRTGALLISNLLLFFAALYAEAARRTHFRQNLGLQRYPDSTQIFSSISSFNLFTACCVVLCGWMVAQVPRGSGDFRSVQAAARAAAQEGRRLAPGQGHGRGEEQGQDPLPRQHLPRAGTYRYVH
jgi:hypothetical protein